jgi:ribosomal protein S18 acetylase RimI-like enzyme
MTAPTDTDLYRRGAATLVASWEEYARGAAGAAVHRLPGVAVAVFPHAPERGVYNNALLTRGMTAAERGAAIDAMEATYAEAGVGGFAAWVHEGDPALRAQLERRGYTIDTSTRAMGMALDELRLPRSELELGPPDWSAYLRLVGVPRDFLSAADPAAYHILLAQLDGESVATGMSYDVDGDCGIYNVGTVEHARRRGLGTALTALLAHDARARGCATASLQSTAMAEGVYATVGFRDLGRFFEYVPAHRTRNASAPSRH